MSHRKKILLIVFIAIVTFIMLFLAVGKLLDNEAERVITQLYVRGDHGVIKGLETKEYKAGHDRAIIFIHGFMRSPETFQHTTQSKKLLGSFDIFVPRLAFHAKDLKTASQMDSKIILTKLEKYIQEVSEQYQQVTVVGYSFGGALTVDMLRRGVLPKNVKVVLYSPAIHIISNNPKLRALLTLYGSWRKYCNYDLMDCSFPDYIISDQYSKNYIENETTLRYRVLPAINQLYTVDSDNRKFLKNTSRYFDLIAVENDSRVEYELLKRDCDANKNCVFHGFSTGNHALHESKNKSRFEELIYQLASANG